MGSYSAGIATGAKDAYQLGSGTLYAYATRIITGKSGGTLETGILAWTTTIPAGAVINSATVKVVGWDESSVETTVAIKVVEDVTATMPTSTAEANSVRSSGTPDENDVHWEIPSQTDGQELTSPDFASVLQRLVDLDNFAGTVIVLLDGGPSGDNGYRSFSTYDDGHAPVLTVSYEEPEEEDEEAVTSATQLSVGLGL